MIRCHQRAAQGVVADAQQDVAQFVLLTRCRAVTVVKIVCVDSVRLPVVGLGMDCADNVCT